MILLILVQKWCGRGEERFLSFFFHSVYLYICTSVDNFIPFEGDTYTLSASENCNFLKEILQLQIFLFFKRFYK